MSLARRRTTGKHRHTWSAWAGTPGSQLVTRYCTAKTCRETRTWHRRRPEDMPASGPAKTAGPGPTSIRP